jgi:hypothetical protein
MQLVLRLFALVTNLPRSIIAIPMAMIPTRTQRAEIAE